MKSGFIKILLVEDNLGDAELLQELLEDVQSAQFSLTHVERLNLALQHLDAGESAVPCPYDIVLLDLSLPDSSGLFTLKQVILTAPSVPIVVLTGCDDEQLALQAVREGAQDYLLKGQADGHLLARSLRYAIERKQTETRILECLEQERELRELKSRFVSMVSHEFRNPLTTIVASADLLQQVGEQLTEDKKHNLYRRIQGSANRMNQLLEDILTIGTTEAKEHSFNPAPLDLIAFCSELVEEFQLSAERQHTITFVSSGSYQNDPLFDQKLLRQILSNLLSNAIKYSPTGSHVRFELICEPTAAIFHIQDEGIGIPLEDQEQLFSAFHRGRNTRGIPGTGLGLVIVKRSVDLHGGQISVKSEVGSGTKFTVTLPYRF